MREGGPPTPSSACPSGRPEPVRGGQSSVVTSVAPRCFFTVPGALSWGQPSPSCPGPVFVHLTPTCPLLPAVLPCHLLACALPTPSSLLEPFFPNQEGAVRFFFPSTIPCPEPPSLLGSSCPHKATGQHDPRPRAGLVLFLETLQSGVPLPWTQAPQKSHVQPCLSGPAMARREVP